jgi:hypothetical protein
MKTERRHELETNTLARGLESWKEWLAPYSTAIVTVILVLMAGYVGATMYSAYQSGVNREAWDEYQLAVLGNDMEQLSRTAQGGDHGGSAMQEWALIEWSDRQLFEAAEQYLSDREAAKKKLASIAGIYEVVADSDSDELRNRARLGLGRTYEMQDRLEDARRQYSLVEGELGAVAAGRIERLEQKKTQEAIKWLATAELPKRGTPLGGGATGARPNFEASVPPIDDAAAPPSGMSLEEIIGGMKANEGDRYGEGAPPGAEGATAAPEGTPPAADVPTGDAPASEPAAESPAAESPAAEAPASEPAAETPAAEAPAAEAPAAEEPAAETPAAEEPAESSETAPAPQ